MKRAKRLRHGYLPNVEAVAAELSESYGDVSHGNKRNPLRELVYIICSVQTNEALYRSTYSELLARFPKFKQLADATDVEIASAIAFGGLSRQKARAIKRVFARLISDFGTPTLLPLHAMCDSDCERYLESLPGVGRKTARCVMMYSLGRAVFPVDVHCWRICRRLGWVRQSHKNGSCSPIDMNRLQSKIPSELRFSLHVNLVSHGRQVCTATKPRCNDCPIRRHCRRIGVSRSL